MRVTASVSKGTPEPASKPEPKTVSDVPKEQVGAENVIVLVDEIPTDQDVSFSDVSSSDVSEIATEYTEKVPTKISSILESAHAFIKNVAPDIVDNLVVGETPIIPLTIEMIEWVETSVLAGKLTGQEKKRIVIKVLLWLIDNQEDILGRDLGLEDDKLRDIIQHVLPSVIDTIIAATKGKILVNKFASTAKSCMSFCCP